METNINLEITDPLVKKIIDSGHLIDPIIVGKIIEKLESNKTKSSDEGVNVEPSSSQGIKTFDLIKSPEKTPENPPDEDEGVVENNITQQLSLKKITDLNKKINNFNKKITELNINLQSNDILKSIFTYDKDHQILKLNLELSKLKILIPLINTFLEIEYQSRNLEYFMLTDESDLPFVEPGTESVANPEPEKNFQHYIPLLIRTLAKIFLTVDITTATGGGKSNFFLKNQKKKTIKKKKTSKRKKSSNKSKKKNKNKKRLSRKRNRKIQNKIGNMVGGDIIELKNQKFKKLSVDDRRSVYAVSFGTKPKKSGTFELNEAKLNFIKKEDSSEHNYVLKIQAQEKKDENKNSLNCFDATTPLAEDKKDYNHSNGPYVYEARIYHKLKHSIPRGEKTYKEGEILEKDSITKASLVDIHSYMYKDTTEQTNPPLIVTSLYKSLDKVKTSKKKNIQAALITEKTDGFLTVKDFLLNDINNTPKIKKQIQQLQIEMLREMFFKHGFVHLDFHDSNCLVSGNTEDNIELKLFDFDFSAIHGFTKLKTFDENISKDFFKGNTCIYAYDFKPKTDLVDDIYEELLLSETIFTDTRLVLNNNTGIDLNEDDSFDLNEYGFYVLGHFYDLYNINNRQTFLYFYDDELLIQITQRDLTTHFIFKKRELGERKKSINDFLKIQTESILDSVIKINEPSTRDFIKIGLDNLFKIAAKFFLKQNGEFKNKNHIYEIFITYSRVNWCIQTNICNLYILAHIFVYFENKGFVDTIIQKTITTKITAPAASAATAAASEETAAEETADQPPPIPPRPKIPVPSSLNSLVVELSSLPSTEI